MTSEPSLRPYEVPGGPPRLAARSGVKYSRDGIRSAIRQWTQEHGAPPTMTDWEPSRARRLGHEWRAERFERGEWPSAQRVRRLYGTFGAAIEDAGLSSRAAHSRVGTVVASPDAVLEAIIEWTNRYGDVPTMADWDPSRARRLHQDWRIARFNQGEWPAARTVARHFGSFNAAIAAAGLTPRPPNLHRMDRSGDRALNRLVLARKAATDRAAGVGDLAQCLRALAAARSRSDPIALHAALIEIAGSALAWAGCITLDEE